MTTQQLPQGGTFMKRPVAHPLYRPVADRVYLDPSGGMWHSSQEFPGKWTRIGEIRDPRQLDSWPRCNPDGSPLPDPRDAEIERLRTERDEAVEVLREIEWAGTTPCDDGELMACPYCHVPKVDGVHHAGCRHAAVLAKSPAPQPAPINKSTAKETNNE